jgi:hypothetical protein
MGDPLRPHALLTQIAYILLNLGIWLVIAGTTFRARPWALLIGRVLKISAILLFAMHNRKRVVSREGQG